MAKTSSEEEKQGKSKLRVSKKLGSVDALNNLREIYVSLKEGARPQGCVHENQDGLIASLLGRERTRSFIPGSGYNVSRV